MAMKVKGRGISLAFASILSSVPILLFSVGIPDFLKLSLFWYALLAPWQTGLVPYGWINPDYKRNLLWTFYVCGFASALLCWFALAEGVRVVAKQRTSKTWLQGISWWILFVVIYGFGAWFLYSFCHAP